MGTRALDDARWLLVDDDWASQRDQARRLLDERREDVLAGSAPAAADALLAEVHRWLATHAPSVADDDGGDLDALAAARRLVAEDLCVLTPEAGGWVLAAGAVCFPSYWRLREKVGRPLGFVHEPVPGYAGGLEARVDGFLGRLRDGQGVWRRNWSIHRTPELFVPAYESVPLPTPDERWLRTEYQTLRRVPGVDAVAFTIRTQQAPVGVLRQRPDLANTMAAALRAWTDRQRAYKGGAVDEALLQWLEG